MTGGRARIMENKESNRNEALKACNVFLGTWDYLESSCLIKRSWLRSGVSSQGQPEAGSQSRQLSCTAYHPFESTTGSAEYRDILYGSHIHGEYRPEARPDEAVMRVMFQRTTGDALDMTLASCDR